MRILLTGLVLSFFTVFVSSPLILAQASTKPQLLSPEACGRVPISIARAWPLTDFNQCTVPIAEIRSGGPGKDGIRSIEMPEFQPISSSTLADTEPVITVSFGGESRTYPLQILIWHEIVNDEVGGVPDHPRHYLHIKGDLRANTIFESRSKSSDLALDVLDGPFDRAIGVAITNCGILNCRPVV